MTTQKIFISVGDERVELIDEDLAAFKAQRSKDQADAIALKAETAAKIAARESALAKLAALGLTADEIAAL